MAADEETGGVAEVAHGRMRRVLREAMARSGGVRRVSGLSLIAVLCASVVAPAALGSSIGPALNAWLGAVGSVGSNLLADVITRVVGEREAAGESAGPQVQQAVAAELEAQMAAPGPEAAALRSAVATLLREHGAQRVLVEELAGAQTGRGFRWPRAWRC